jgi:hypothetical protein
MSSESEQGSSWSWINPSASAASCRSLQTAANAVWPYAKYCAWSYLDDDCSAYDLMDYAIEHSGKYLARFQFEPPTEKLVSRLRPLIRRRAKQLARRRVGIPSGALLDLEEFAQQLREQPEAEQRVYAREILEKLSPQARAVALWRRMGYSWRVIGRNLDLEHSHLRRAYLREIHAAVQGCADPEKEGS